METTGFEESRRKSFVISFFSFPTDYNGVADRGHWIIKGRLELCRNGEYRAAAGFDSEFRERSQTRPNQNTDPVLCLNYSSILMRGHITPLYIHSHGALNHDSDKELSSAVTITRWV